MAQNDIFVQIIKGDFLALLIALGITAAGKHYAYAVAVLPLDFYIRKAFVRNRLEDFH